MKSTTCLEELRIEAINLDFFAGIFRNVNWQSCKTHVFMLVFFMKISKTAKKMKIQKYFCKSLSFKMAAGFLINHAAPAIASFWLILQLF